MVESRECPSSALMGGGRRGAPQQDIPACCDDSDGRRQQGEDEELALGGVNRCRDQRGDASADLTSSRSDTFGMTLPVGSRMTLRVVAWRIFKRGISYSVHAHSLVLMRWREIPPISILYGRDSFSQDLQAQSLKLPTEGMTGACWQL